MLKLVHQGTGAVAFQTGSPSGFLWPRGTVPEFSTTSGYIDLVSVYNDGTVNYGNAGAGYR